MVPILIGASAVIGAFTGILVASVQGSNEREAAAVRKWEREQRKREDADWRCENEQRKRKKEQRKRKKEQRKREDEQMRFEQVLNDCNEGLKLIEELDQTCYPALPK